MKSGMKIVVTGALGHIGSRLVRSIPRVGGRVVMLDNLCTQRFFSLFDLPREGKYSFVEADVTRADLRPHFEGAGAVIHLAALTDAASSFTIKDALQANNLEATRRVAAACRETGAGLVFASTTSVYGPQTDNVDEDCGKESLKPQSPYAETKLREEDLLLGMAAEGLRVVILRLGTIFGTSPGMRFHTAVNKFCWQASMGIPVSVWKTALNQVRPYLDLEDAVRAFFFVIEKGIFDGRIYNAVTANATVSEILDVIRKRIPDLRIELVETPIMNQLSYRVSSARIEGRGFRFEGQLERGVNQTLDLLAAACGRASGSVAR